MKAGALDAFITPIQMKKSRKAIKLTVLCDPKIKDRILDGIFTLTTAFGVRIYMVKREKLSRKHIKVKTKYGTVRIKAGYTLAPEFEDIKKLAKKHRLPLSKINQAAWNKLK
jgi:uncharacterized protein (DUF111 family)